MTEHYIFGMHAVKALVNINRRPIKRLFINQERQDKRLQEIVTQANSLNITVEPLSAKQMNQRFAEFNHQGIAAIAGQLPNYNESDLKYLLATCQQAAFILILDGVTDPHNLGACLRTADAAGVDFVIIPKDKNAALSSVVSKVACGAAETIPLVRVTNLIRAMEIIKQEGVWIYGATGEAPNLLYQLEGQSAIAIVVGAEGDGLRRLTREHCDGLFALPMFGSVESLNVSVAASITLYEIVRQRHIS